jgi:hypothetical protein
MSPLTNVQRARTGTSSRVYTSSSSKHRQIAWQQTALPLAELSWSKGTAHSFTGQFSFPENDVEKRVAFQKMEAATIAVSINTE